MEKFIELCIVIGALIVLLREFIDWFIFSRFIKEDSIEIATTTKGKSKKVFLKEMGEIYDEINGGKNVKTKWNILFR